MGYSLHQTGIYLISHIMEYLMYLLYHGVSSLSKRYIQLTPTLIYHGISLLTPIIAISHGICPPYNWYIHLPSCHRISPISTIFKGCTRVPTQDVSSKWYTVQYMPLRLQLYPYNITCQMSWHITPKRVSYIFYDIPLFNRYISKQPLLQLDIFPTIPIFHGISSPSRWYI